MTMITSLPGRVLLIAVLSTTVQLTWGTEPVTNEQLEAIEKLIEQQEAALAEEKKRAEEAKRKAEEEQRQAELSRKKDQEKMRLDEEKAKLIELERKQQQEERLGQEEEKQQAKLKQKLLEEEAFIKAENKKKEKYLLLIAEAQRALSNKDKDLAIQKYNESLLLYPDDQIAKLGIEEANKLSPKVCYKVIGDWEWPLGAKSTFLENGKYIGIMLGIKSEGTWECTSPIEREITVTVNGIPTVNTLSENGNVISNILATGWRKGFRKSLPEQNPKSQSKNLSFGQ